MKRKEKRSLEKSNDSMLVGWDVIHYGELEGIVVVMLSQGMATYCIYCGLWEMK